MNIRENVSLRPYNTFGIEANARFLTGVKTPENIIELWENPRFKNLPKLILGEGSNVLFLQDFEGLVVRNELEGEIESLNEGKDFVEIRVPGGMHWHDVVTYAVKQNWQGIENLALIPGKAATAPFQNIGAYGTEIADALIACHIIDLKTLRPVSFTREQCRFGYRNSIFKQNKGRHFITAIDLRLYPGRKPQVRYRALENYLHEKGVEEPDIQDIYEAVIHIRQSKLPDPAVTGNAGSFFKNPVVPKEKWEALKEKFSDIPTYPAGENQVKIPAGWLIDRAGWKGFREGDAGVHPKQALVLVNYGNATGFQIYKLSERIRADIYDRYGIELEREVQIIR